MKSTLIFFALVALSEGSPLARTLEGRIINGTEAEEGEFPYQVSLQYLFDFHFCGGSILNKQYVVTAAHCVQGKSAADIKVIAGTTNLMYPQSVHYAIAITVHADYNPSESFSNDIALIKVEKSFKFSKTISYVPLPESHAEVATESAAIVSGWGTLRQGASSTPKKLQRTNVRITDQKRCSEINGGVGAPVYKGHICAYDDSVETGPCNGDSGGPLTVNGTIVGIASWVITCGSSKHPTVYTRVPEYIEWIYTHAV